MKTEQKLYEIAFLLQDPASEKEVVDLINQFQGSVKNQISAKPLRLAYPVLKHTSAYFGVCQFELLSEAIERLSQALQLKKSVLRFLIVVPPATRKAPERSGEKRPFVKAEAATKSVLTNDVLEAKLAALENESR